MANVAVVLSNPAAPAVEPKLLAHLAGLLPHAGAARTLNPGIAAEIPFARADRPLKELQSLLQAEIGKAPVDVAVLP
ncbi:MAG: phosphoserine phosphatase SerB, partial [Beijerinckiaceae bacterium]